jgi:hypothetical protein
VISLSFIDVDFLGIWPHFERPGLRYGQMKSKRTDQRADADWWRLIRATAPVR